MKLNRREIIETNQEYGTATLKYVIRVKYFFHVKVYVCSVLMDGLGAVSTLESLRREAKIARQWRIRVRRNRNLRAEFDTL